jgi:two-component sensor histidine kinase/HAMP domain-containing protein/sensor domain CHASE-containing protein
MIRESAMMRITNNLTNLRLSVKIMLVLSTVIAAMTIMATLVAYNGVNNLSVKAGNERIIEEVLVIQSQIAEAENRLIDDTQYLAQDLAINQAVNSSDLTAIQISLLLDDTIDIHGIDHVLVVDADGSPLVTLVDRKVVPANDSLSDELLAFALLGIPVSDVLNSDTPVMAVAAPVQSNTGEIVGAVQIGRKLDDDFLQSINFSRPGVHLVLLNPDGEIIAAFIDASDQRSGDLPSLIDEHQPETDGGQNVKLLHSDIVLDQEAIEQALNGEVAYPSGFAHDQSGRPLAVGYVPFLVNYDIEGVLVILVDLDTLTSFRDDLISQQIVVLALLGLVSAIILALLGWYLIALPLGKLQQATYQLVRGDYSPQASDHGRDELGQLATAFTEMANTLHARDQQILAEIAERSNVEQALRKTKNELEQRVTNRTKELQETNERLQTELEQREQIEKQVRATLQEKEILLKEIHHRVKNNMQVMSSLLHLQSNYIEDTHDIEMLRESQHRIQSMALVHEQLYQSPDLTGIDANNYVNDLITNLFRSYGQVARQITIDLQVDDLLLDVDTAIPCGLILNELVSNAIKHGFPNGRSGEIHVGLKGRDNRLIELLVRDNGVGISEDTDLAQIKSLGLQLVSSLSRQLDGTVEIIRDGGTMVRLRLEEAHPN